jgi:hypothetical protein
MENLQGALYRMEVLSCAPDGMQLNAAAVDAKASLFLLSICSTTRAKAWWVIPG